jgi:hypothetical protein
VDPKFHILKKAEFRPGAVRLSPAMRQRYGRGDFLLGEDRLGSETVDGISSDTAVGSLLTSTNSVANFEIGKMSTWLKDSVDGATLQVFQEKSREWSPAVRDGVNAMLGSNRYKMDVGEVISDGVSTLTSVLSVAAVLAAIPDPSLVTKIVAGAVIVGAIAYYAVTDWHELSKIFKDPPRFRYWIEAWGGNLELLNEKLYYAFAAASRGTSGGFGASGWKTGATFDAMLGTQAWNGEKIARTFYKLKTLREGQSLFASQPEFGDAFHAIPYEDHVRALARSAGLTIPKISGTGWSTVNAALASGGDEYSIAAITSILLAWGKYDAGGTSGFMLPADLIHVANDWPEIKQLSSQPNKWYNDRPYNMVAPLVSNDYRDIYAASATLHQESFARADAYGFPSALRFYYLNQSVQMQMPDWGAGSSTPSVKRAVGNRQALHSLADMPGRQKFQGVIIGLIRAQAYQLLGEIIQGIPAKLTAIAGAIEQAGASTFKQDLVYPSEVLKNIDQDAINVASGTGDPKALQAVMNAVRAQPILQSIYKDRFIAPPKDSSGSGAGIAIAAALALALSQG